MNLKDVRPSNNFVDLTGLPKMLSMIFDTQAKQEQNINDAFRYQPPGGYAHWIISELNNLTPAERDMITKQGLSLPDIYLYRDMLRHQVPLDPTVPMYTRETIRKQADYWRHR